MVPMGGHVGAWLAGRAPHASMMRAKTARVGLWLAVVTFGVARAQDTAFHYQGRMADAGRPANGSYDFRATLFGEPNGGSGVAGPQAFDGLWVTNGLFNLALDFGEDAFVSASRWIEISVRTNGAASFTTLSPRRQLTPQPQAIFAGKAGTVLTLPASAITGILARSNLPDGPVLTDLNASALASGTVPDARFAEVVARLTWADATTSAASNSLASLAWASSNGVATRLQDLGGTVLRASNSMSGMVLANSNILSGRINTTSNALGSRINGTQASLADAVAAMSARLSALEAASYPASGLVAPSLPGGLTVVSASASDVSLLRQGLVSFGRIDAPSWSSGSTLNAPGGRHAHGAAWTGSALMVWGGLNGTTPLNTGGVYDVGNDVWTTLPTLNAPEARRGHALAWTGSHLVVWGGQGNTFLATGGRYSTTSQTWSPTSVVGAPAARTDHAFAWTTARLFVWGGRNEEGLMSDGALYDPGANAWQAIPSTGSPSARRGATATWCGDRVIVFGGQADSGEVNTGAVLPFAGGSTPGTWQSTAVSGAPVARQGHTAIWTGSRLLVWGGKWGGVPLNSGAAYDPATATWTPLSTTSAPTARSGHAAVWTGREMVVFGGEDTAEPLATGGRYDPATDTWQPLSLEGDPLARRAHTGAWTGAELVVFGGQGAGTSPTSMASVQRLIPEGAWYLYRRP